MIESGMVVPRMHVRTAFKWNFGKGTYFCFVRFFLSFQVVKLWKQTRNKQYFYEPWKYGIYRLAEKLRKFRQNWNCPGPCKSHFKCKCLFFLSFNICYIILPLPLPLSYFASFTINEDDIFEFISNLHVKRYKFGGKMDKFGKTYFKPIFSM